jgi:hypothetical protein
MASGWPLQGNSGQIVRTELITVIHTQAPPVLSRADAPDGCGRRLRGGAACALSAKSGQSILI